MKKLLGLDVITDNDELLDILRDENPAPMEDVESLFPGMRVAIVLGMKHLGERRLRADKLTYLNCRVQVWSQPGFDCDPSPPARILPAGAITDDMALGAEGTQLQ